MSEIKRLVAPFEIKSVDTGERTFEGYAATWDVDLGDDVIHKGAFKDTLADWRASGQAMPLLNSHNYFDVMAGVGQLVDAKEDKRGLWTKWEVIDGADGDAILHRMRPSKRTGRAVIGSMSIGYEAQKFDFEASDTAKFGQLRNLRQVGLRETSLVLFPMNTQATIDVASVKSAMASHPLPEDERSVLVQVLTELGDTLSPAPEAPTDEKSSDPWATPGDTPLDLLRLQRMRSRSSSLRAGTKTFAREKYNG